jgi:diguanylate cyclase (GGDEF)-like protein/PAS domain S-box-containing protein
MTANRPNLLPGLVLVLALALTWLVWDHEQHAARQELKAHFEHALSEAVSRIEQRMAAYNQILRGVQGLVRATGKPDRDSFHRYVDTLQGNADFSDAQVIGLIDYVPLDKKAAHIAAMRRHGFADYRVQPEGERAVYAPVIQREPYLGANRIPPGFDAWNEPTRRAALERSRDSGNTAVSGKVRLTVDAGAADAPAGFVMYLPLYAKDAPLESIEQRRRHLTGWIFAAFRMRDLMASLYGELPPGLALAVHDGVEIDEANLLYRSPDWGKQPAIMHADEYLVIAGHTWTLSLVAEEDYASRFGRNAADVIAWSGIGLSLLLALLAWLLTTGRSRALKLAASMTRDLRESEQRWAFALEGAGDGVWDWDIKANHIVTSKRWREIMGFGSDNPAEMLDDWRARIHPEDLPTLVDTMQTCLGAPPGSAATCVAEYRVRDGNDQWKWVLSRGMAVEHDAQGEPLRVIGTITDINERKAIEERIRHMAQHDSLTDLPNRALFSDRIEHALASARRHNQKFALIFLDLDHFKPINDHYGHDVGDRLLQQVARRLQVAVRSSDTVGRIGGDEFVILMPELAELDDAYGLGEKIRRALNQPFTIDEYLLNISCSLGIAIYPDHGEDEISLAKSADEAMYVAKQSGRNSVRMA